MFAQALTSPTDMAIALLDYYSFDLGGRTVSDIMQRWQHDYPTQWIYLATIEALYQGRYKALSVDQILAIWQRKGEVSHHFNHEFERLVCGSFTQKLHYEKTSSKSEIASKESSKSDTFTFFKIGKRSNADQKTASKAEIVKMRAIAEQQEQKESRDKLLLSSNTNNPPIKRFSPHFPDAKEFYGKLKAIAKNSF
jgi:hypothetical protein